MFTSILIPVDLSDRNTEALKVAHGMAGVGGKLTLIHAVELIPGLEREEEPAFYDRLEAAAQKKLGEQAAALEAQGQITEVVIEAGRRVEIIVGWAEAHDVDLIVLASHRIDPASPVKSWGTLSYQIGLLSPCSVLLVK